MRVPVLLVLLLLSRLATAAERPHVYLVVVDGLGMDMATPATMPRLFAETRVQVEARAAMPTRTNPNHATLLTGLLPESHGITGNDAWDRTRGALAKLESPDDLEAETLFTIVETTDPARVTVGAFSKAKLGRLFAASRHQRAPDVLWAPEEGAHLGVASDMETMEAFLKATADREPDLAAINLSEVDRVAHEQGPAATMGARRDADAAIGRLVDDLRARGRFDRALLIVTADHGFDAIAPTRARPHPVVVLADRFRESGIASVHVAADGGVAHIVADGITDGHAPESAIAALAWAAGVAWRETGVADVLARVRVPGVTSLGTAHPEWGLEHERTGDLLVVAAPGYTFADPGDTVTASFLGNHGSPREMRVPLALGGGVLADAPSFPTAPSAADVGATIASVLGVRLPRRFDGKPIRAGHPLALPLRAPSS
jgi:arylsulfatase A-like enzyme